MSTKIILFLAHSINIYKSTFFFLVKVTFSGNHYALLTRGWSFDLQSLQLLYSKRKNSKIYIFLNFDYFLLLNYIYDNEF